MKNFLLLMFCLPTFMFGQNNLPLEVLVKKYDSISSIPELKLLDNYSQNYSFKKKLEKTIFAEAKKTDLIGFYKSEISLNLRKTIVNNLFAEKDSATIIKLFKATININDTVANSHVSRNFEPKIGYIIYNGELFEELTGDSEIFGIKQSAIKDKLLNYIFSTKPLNEKLISNIQYALPLKEEYYDAVKSLIKEKDFPYLLSYIARFKKQEDIEYIKSFGKKSFFAIQEFPDDKFIPFLEQFVEQFSKDDNLGLKSTYFDTVAAFCSPKGKTLVEKILNAKNSEKFYFIRSLNRRSYDFKTKKQINNYCEIYFPLIKDAWIKDGILDEYVYENYTKNKLNKQELAKYLYDGFINNKIDDIPYLVSNYNDKPSFILSEIKSMKKSSKKLYYKVVGKYISDLRYLSSLKFLIIYLDDNKSIVKAEKTIRNRLDTEDNPYYLIQSVRALNKLKNKNLFNYGVRILKKRKPEILKTNNDIWIKNLIDFEKEYSLSL